jgi:uncharacterized protein (TIGR04255 family)
MGTAVLNKPPIVEMWVEFSFDPNPADGGLQAAVEFLQKYADQYPELEISQEDRLEFRQVSTTKLPELVRREVAVKHIRAHDKNGFGWVHVTPTQLACGFLRLGVQYPGFTALCDEAVGKLGRYAEVCTPLKLKYAAIHYVDVIEVPVPANGEIELRDYFTLGVDLPAQPFGGQLSYFVRTAVKPPDGTGSLEIQLQLSGVVPDARVFRFRMDWHKSCPYDREVDLGAVAANLRGGHESVMKCFRAAFTDRAWELFDPKE